MNGQARPIPGMPKGSAMSITVKDGRTFAICSPGQMAYLRQAAIEDIMLAASERNETIRDQEQLDRLLDQWQETCPYATLAWVLAKLSPQEQKDWATRYRFQGISSSPGGQK